MIFIQLYMQQTKSFYGKIEFLTENIKSTLNIDLQIRRIVDVLFKKRAGPRLKIVSSGLKHVSPLEVFKPDNTRLPVFFSDIDQLILALLFRFGVLLVWKTGRKVKPCLYQI